MEYIHYIRVFREVYIYIHIQYISMCKYARAHTHTNVYKLMEKNYTKRIIRTMSRFICTCDKLNLGV